MSIEANVPAVKAVCIGYSADRYVCVWRLQC